MSGSTKSNLIRKERIGHIQTRPDLAIIQPTSLDNTEWPIPSGKHFQDPPVGEMEKEIDSLVEKMQDEGTYVSQNLATSHYMQLEEENSPLGSGHDFPHQER